MSLTKRVSFAFVRMPMFFVIVGLLVVQALVANAQGIRFEFNQIRATVPVNSTNVSYLGLGNVMPRTNDTIILVDGVTNASLSLSGLPAGASASILDTNGIPVSYITKSTNIVVKLDTTNITQGVYVFTLNANGVDTNGVPVTNSFPFVIQSAYIWKGGGLGVSGFSVSNNWANASSWQGVAGVPTTTSDVVFGDSGAQTNTSFTGGLAYTNVGIDSSLTIASLRFSQNAYTNLVVTNGLVHTLKLASGTTLTLTGTNGFSLLRDTIGELGYSPYSAMGVNINGTNAALMVTNDQAYFSIAVGSQVRPTLSISNLGTLITYVKRVGLSDYQLYPNYRAMNDGYNGGRTITNYGANPRQMWNNVFLARTNYITATYADPNNYTNEYTRGYAFMYQNNEQTGNGSSVDTFLVLGVSNVFKMDGICFVGSSSAVGNNGAVRFNRPASTAIFRGTNGGRMSVFTISDDGGTNMAGSNVKGTIDFSGPTNYVDILADRLYISRDRTMIQSNQTPNVQGDLIIGYGNVDVNTAILGFQEHSNKIDWTTLYGAQAYLNYCQGRLIITNGGLSSTLGGTVRVNNALTLGFTADMNPASSAHQYETRGQIVIQTNATLIANKIVCDGGLNYYDGNGRQNTITINQGGTLVVSNTVGFLNFGASDFTAADPRGMLLDTLTIAAGKLTLSVDTARTNIFVRNLVTPGLIPGVIKVASLAGVSSYPVQVPVISYQGSASPFLTADVSALGVNFYGYVINNTTQNTVDLYITTNSPNNLVWTGGANISTADWNTTDINWKTDPGGVATNFHLGDAVRFDDTSTVTNVNVVGQMVPSQSGAGVTISNKLYQYTFSGGAIAGTALTVKQGTNLLTFNASAQGPLNLTEGSVVGSGTLGNTTTYSNTVLNYTGTINGGLTSTGIVTYAGSGLNGPISIQGNYLDNAGTINTTLNQLIVMAAGTAITNRFGATINVGSGPGNGQSWIVPAGSTLANFGTIKLYQPGLRVEGLFFGNGVVNNPNGGGLESNVNGNSPLLRIQGGGVMGIGDKPSGTIGTMDVQCRFDFNNDPTAVPFNFTTILVDFDFSNPQTNDIINCDRWNNDTGLLLFTNINPGAGTFANGQVFTILNNTSLSGTNNNVDTTGFSPFIKPYVPGPGLVWGTTNFNGYGTISVTTNAMVWDGVTTATWGTNLPGDASWKVGKAFQENMGAFFGDNANGSTYITLITNVAPAGIRGASINSNQPAVYPGIIVSNATKNYVFDGPGKITGITGIYKTGSGTLTLLTTNANDFSGNVIIEQGTLAVSNFGANVNILSLGTAGGGQMKNDLIMDGGTLSYVGTTNVNLNHFPVLYSGNGTFHVASATNRLNLDRAVSGPGTLTKTGPGVLALSGASVYPGGTIVSEGGLRINAAGVAGYGPVSFANNTVLEVTNSFNFTNDLNFVSGSVTALVLGASTNVLTGSWFGAASVTFSNVNPLFLSCSLTGFSGTISFGSTTANYQFNSDTNKNPCTGSALASFDLGTGANTLSNLNGAGLTYNLGALSGGANTILAGRSTNSFAPAGTTYRIGANGNSTTFSGAIANGLDTVTVVKVGSGSLFLNGANTYTGSTTVSNGVLGGTGSIASPLTVVAGGTLAPGTSVGTFTVSNTATLGGTTVMELNPTNSDLLNVTGTITSTGNLVVTNIGGTLYNGKVFTLFSKPVSGFSNIKLPSGYTWTTNLAVNGSITVSSGGVVNPTPVTMTNSLSGSTLTLGWPADHIGWILQVQTNSLSTGLANNWVTVPGSTNVTGVSVNIDANSGSVFYRLVYP